ncbi:(2Fe-2S)-binding protein [Rhizobium aegyptiacum]|uniref:(2Fe-2S)-binding protein n=1 Tax=Rhizobium aegyptiacum TaxID=1764550 RepID=UPI0007E587B4|nr:(2Fe-2S)-binding protein [Rhizobium aegyptiacum]
MSFALDVDGRRETVDAPDDAPLLYVLRNDLEKSGPKFGCGLAQCGACMVLVDGTATPSCVTPARSVEGAKIETVASLQGADGALHPVQAAFIAEEAAQCGYCTSGMIITAVALLRTTPNPTEIQIREALDGNLCRCGAHPRIVRAVLRAAKESR